LEKANREKEKEKRDREKKFKRIKHTEMRENSVKLSESRAKSTAQNNNKDYLL